MIIISSRTFRDNQAKYLNKVDEGEQVIVQRGKNKAYKLSSVKDEDVFFTPQMIIHLKESIQQAKEGEATSINNRKELNSLLESL